jgi:hypothetical protein
MVGCDCKLQISRIESYCPVSGIANAKAVEFLGFQVSLVNALICRRRKMLLFPALWKVHQVKIYNGLGVSV